MAHTFTLKLNEPAGEVLGRIADEIKYQGGEFSGNDDQGSFIGKSPLGPIRVAYHRITESEIRITIVEKPVLIPYGRIESEIRNYLA